MAELMSRNHCWGSKTMSKSLSGMKSFGLTNQSSKSLTQIRGSLCGKELVKELQPLVPPNHKAWRRLCYCVVRLLLIANLLIESDQLSQYTAASHNPIWMQLVSQGFVLMQDNDPKHSSKLFQNYIKSKEEQYILQLISWPR